ncbi:hypothetical protein BDQ17DRAFT_1362552 [Cyathus striatus]|nr:hypothetical protein BDQ17DRAFT_1362552 [Cyathus striatus]
MLRRIKKVMWDGGIAIYRIQLVSRLVGSLLVVCERFRAVREEGFECGRRRGLGKELNETRHLQPYFGVYWTVDVYEYIEMFSGGRVTFLTINIFIRPVAIAGHKLCDTPRSTHCWSSFVNMREGRGWEAREEHKESMSSGQEPASVTSCL